MPFPVANIMLSLYMHISVSYLYSNPKIERRLYGFQFYKNVVNDMKQMFLLFLYTLQN